MKPMHTFLNDLKWILFGAAATTTAEYFLKYNLLDFLKDKVLALFGHKA